MIWVNILISFNQILFILSHTNRRPNDPYEWGQNRSLDRKYVSQYDRPEDLYFASGGLNSQRNSWNSQPNLLPGMQSRHPNSLALNLVGNTPVTGAPAGSQFGLGGGVGGGGRRLPQPPPVTQKPLKMSGTTGTTPLPMSQKQVVLSTRNRKLPRVPASVGGTASSQHPNLNQANVGVGIPVSNRLGGMQQDAQGRMGMRGRGGMDNMGGNNNVRNSKSFNMPFR